MKNKELEELLGDDSPVEDVTLDLDLVKSLIPQYSNEKLCEMIVCDRYFGFGEKLSPICMEELARRRIAGDTFDFESYIDQTYKELPVLDLTIPDVRSILHQAIGRKLNHQ